MGVIARENTIIKCEENWGLFRVFEGKKPGKKSKKPIAVHSPDWPAAVNQAFLFSREEIVEEWERLKGEGFDVLPGYLPREGSEWIVVDLDDCVGGWGDELLEGYEGYQEKSVSGTGYRLLMPREDGDEEKFGSSGEKNGVGVFCDGKKGAIVRLDGSGDIGVRDERVLAAVLERRGIVGGKKRDVVEGKGLDDLPGGTSIEDFREMVRVVPNVGIDRLTWIGMKRAVRENFERCDDGKWLEEAKELSDAWDLSRDEGEYFEGFDQEENDRVWNEKKEGNIGATGMGSWWRLYTKEKAVDAVSEGAAEVPVLLEDQDDVLARYVLCAGEIVDLLDDRVVSGGVWWNMTAKVKLVWQSGNGVKVVKSMQAARLHWFASHAVTFDYKALLPGRDRIIEGEMLVAGRLEKRAGVRGLNTWVRPRRGRGGSGGVGVGRWQQLVTRFCMGDATVAGHVMDWMAWQVQRAGEKIGYALVLGDKEGGTGKDLLLTPMMMALGRGGNWNVTQGDIEGAFNQWVEGITLGVVQEAHVGRWMDNRVLAEKLKTLISGRPDTLTINAKFRGPMVVPNVLNIAMVTNNDDGLYIKPKDRRYYVVWSDVRPLTNEEGERYARWEKEEGGIEAVIEHLWTRDISGIVAGGRAPESKGVAHLAQASAPDMLESVEAYIGGRDWVTSQQVLDHLKAAGDSEVLPAGTKSQGRQLTESLAFLGWRQVKLPGDARGRIKAGGLYHKVFAPGEGELGGIEVVRQVIAAEKWSAQFGHLKSVG